MKLIAYFDTFLRDTVNLNKSALGDLDSRVGSVSTAIKASDALEGRVIDVVPQGSWAHSTIIKPAAGLEFDADFLLQIEENPDWADNPCAYSDAIHEALSNHGTYGPKTSRKNRCIRVTYANDCHIDVVPYVVLATGAQVIVNRSTNQFEDTNPIGFSEWIQEKDDITGGNLRKTIRLLKYLRDHRSAFSIKSVLLTTMVGNMVDQWRGYDPSYYKDVPTTLVHLVEDLDRWLQANWTKPSISDPSCPTTTFDHRWTDKQYEAFRDRIRDLAPKLRSAYDAPTTAASVEQWQGIFGSDFPSELAKTASLSPPASRRSAAFEPRAPGEEFIEDRFEVALSESVTIDCEVGTPVNRAERRLLRARAGRVPKARKLRFFVRHTTATGPYDVYWKVRNFGREAADRGQLRGQILKDEGRRERTERTRYLGDHYVECYIVQEGRCVAVAHHDVTIR